MKKLICKIVKTGSYEKDGTTRNWMIISTQMEGFEVSGICNPVTLKDYEVGKEVSIPEKAITFN